MARRRGQPRAGAGTGAVREVVPARRRAGQRRVEAVGSGECDCGRREFGGRVRAYALACAEDADGVAFCGDEGGEWVSGV